jgi:hypothetical protein
MAAIDPDILATLTDEERAAIEEGMTDSEKEALAALAEEGDDDDDDNDDNSTMDAAPIEGKGADAGDSGTVKPGADDKPADGAQAAAADDKPSDEEVAPEKFKPQYEASLPQDFDDQVKAVSEESRALAQQFKDGEIDFDEFESKRAELDSKRDELRELKVKAEIATEMSQQSAQQEWTFTVKSFVRATAKSDGIDYARDEAKRGDLDMFVKALAQDPKTADKEMGWFLEEAHRRVKALHGLGKQEAAAPAGEKKPEKPNRKPPLDAAPKTLAQVPGGDGPGDVGDEFADLDSLEGEALERAIAKMSPAQREKFAMGA